MKKDRNCGGMPIYPNMVPNFGGVVMPGQMIPMQGSMMNMPMNDTFTTTTTQTNYTSSDLNTLTNQINSLEQRVNRLENLVNNGTYSNNYNSSNYQMM